MSDMSPMEEAVVRTALTRMFRPDGYFDICTLDNLVKLARVMVPERTRLALHALHCVHWRDMEPEVRQHVADTVLGLFALPTFNVTFAKLDRVRVVEADVAPEKRPLLLRLLGRGA
jgi:hypothetical protein